MAGPARKETGAGHLRQGGLTFETLVFPYIGSRPIAKLGAVDVLKVLKRIEGRGIHETAHRTRQRCAQVFRYAVQTARAERDPTVDLKGALAPVVKEHHAAITEPARIGDAGVGGLSRRAALGRECGAFQARGWLICEIPHYPRS